MVNVVGMGRRLADRFSIHRSLPAASLRAAEAKPADALDRRRDSDPDALRRSVLDRHAEFPPHRISDSLAEHHGPGGDRRIVDGCFFLATLEAPAAAAGRSEPGT